MRKRFWITSLLAAGFIPYHSAHGAVVSIKPALDPDSDQATFKSLGAFHRYTLAAHRSHSSHSSHSSHRSSSSGGYSVPSTPKLYVPPPEPTVPRNYNSTPPESVLPSPPAAAEQYLPALPGNSRKFERIVMRVQTELFFNGYYMGDVDGKVGPETRTAIAKLQADRKLKVTGTITPEVLNALGIVAE